LTANALAGQAEVFLENGFDGFISKPIDIRQLNATLNKLIRDKYPTETVEAARQQAAMINMANAAAKEQSVFGPELAAIFARDAEKALARLSEITANEFRRKDDFRQYVIDVHSMKSALANIGQGELSAAALRLERAGRAEDIKIMAAETPVFLEALSEVIEKTKPKEDAGEASQEVSDNDRVYLSEKLLIIQITCENYDETTANSTLTELKQKQWPRSVRELLDTIAENLLHSDFEDAAKLARDTREDFIYQK
jgi:HPt (histidine-containing phosphotransfer) domain-containing protein